MTVFEPPIQAMTPQDVHENAAKAALRTHLCPRFILTQHAHLEVFKWGNLTPLLFKEGLGVVSQ